MIGQSRPFRCSGEIPDQRRYQTFLDFPNRGVEQSFPFLDERCRWARPLDEGVRMVRIALIVLTVAAIP